MKTVLVPLCLLACISLPAGEGGFVRQIQTINGQSVIYDIPISSDTGSIVSSPLPSETAVFQLYTTVSGPNNTQTLTKLDEKTVGTFLPTVTAEILSEDPYFPPRTRADRPYGVRLNISGLLANAPEVQDHLKTVHVARSYKLYDPVIFQPNGTGGTYADTFSFRQNGTFVDNGILQRLPGESPSRVIGEESFTVSLHPNAGMTAELSKATVQIWPVTSVEIQGIEEGKKYTAIPDTAKVLLKDIYPHSVTYAQVYSGAHQVGTEGLPLPGTVIAYNTHAPQSALIPLSELRDIVRDEGAYTIEILTITPFNEGAPELLARLTFSLSTTISVHGGLTDAE